MQTVSLQLYCENIPSDSKKEVITNTIHTIIGDSGYSVVGVNIDKPWGSYLCIDSANTDKFIEEFFPFLSPDEARLGVIDAELSPKILIVAPGQRLSWQYHNRRAECWRFLTQGMFNKSISDEEGDKIEAHAGDIVQFKKSERHRLNGVEGMYVVVAEIWQHTDSNNLSDEEDIVRLQDDYMRE